MTSTAPSTTARRTALPIFLLRLTMLAAPSVWTGMNIEQHDWYYLTISSVFAAWNFVALTWRELR